MAVLAPSSSGTSPRGKFSPVQDCFEDAPGLLRKGVSADFFFDPEQDAVTQTGQGCTSFSMNFTWSRLVSGRIA